MSEKKEFYVWYDNFLEEHFAIEKNDMDSNFKKLKTQLSLEKVEFHVVSAEYSMEAVSKFKDSLKKDDCEPSFKKRSIH